MLYKAAIILMYFILGLTLHSQDSPYFIINKNEPKSYPLQFAGDTNIYVQGIWSNLSNLPNALMGTNTYYDSLGARIFICGGLGLNSVPNDTCRWFNISTGTYQQAALLPEGRWSGKLVKVKNDLYLVGSIDSFFTNPDGIIYKYSLSLNQWSVCDTMPAPYLQECAVCVINDSLIVTVGGSENGFSNPRNLVRLYNPALNQWINTNVFPINITTAHAEFNISEGDSSVFVFGGYSSGNLNTVYKGKIYYNNSDTLKFAWQLFCNTPLNTGIYRVAGTRWKDYMLFGPSMSGSTSINSIWGLSYVGGYGYWTGFQPGSPDTAGNIATFSALSGNDSNYFYLFGGYKNPNILNTVSKYSFITPPPIGIWGNHDVVPEKFKLYQNYPNPFNPQTKIKFEIPKYRTDTDITLKIYDISGRLVAEYILSNYKYGIYEISFNASNLSSGIYFYTLSSGEEKISRKMIILK